jgi:glycosyltransferase involved in cell wall biosynthesis
MFCSTIIPTIGRPTLSRAVNSVLNQSFSADDFEIIVVNDSGNPLPYTDWQRSNRVQVIHTNRHERSVARNAGAAIAKGKYLHFLDDDDWILPGALHSFWELVPCAKRAIWLYGGSQLVDRKGNNLIKIRHGVNGNCFIQVMAGEWIPLQASLLDATTFFAIGGFNPKLSGPEDIDLCRRIALIGDFAETSSIVACLSMGQEGSTTNQEQSVKLRRWAREGILELPGAFSRMRSSARGNQWKGCITRIYLTSVVWNLQSRRLFTALSRATYGFLSLILAAFSLFSINFWRSVFYQYESITFSRGFLEKDLAEKSNKANLN